MMLVRTAMPVRGVVREQTARTFGWKGPALFVPDRSDPGGHPD
jgi:hypothetical protein